MVQAGKVYLVGAGVGSQEYLTIKARELIKVAQVIIYDALVEPSLLNLAPPHCLKICVGKRGGQASTTQSEINKLLVAYCLSGQQIVRLKSGDPLIFGRANEEIAALVQAHCNYEIVPGISSILAAPLLAGITLTDKKLSRFFAVISGHQPQELDWASLSEIDTLVILMGGRSLPQIINYLIEYGRSPTESIAIIRNCGRPQQQIFWGTLTDIVVKTAQVSLSPAVIVIGKVVQQRYQNPHQTSSSLPLVDKTILVTRAVEQSSKFTALLQQQGATVVEMPALEITPPSSWAGLDQAIAKIAQFQWLILTSANGVEYFWQHLTTLGYDARALGAVKIAVVGRKTAAALQKKQLNPDYIPPNYVADSLVANFPEDLSGQKILFPRVETGGRAILVEELTSQGASVVEVAAYQSQCPQEIDPAAWATLEQRQIDFVTFASSKTVKNFYQLLQQQTSQKEIESILNDVCIASIGPQTSKTCRELIGRIDLEAAEYTLEGLTTAIINHKIS
ncbi:MAG: uroporphyrinogen-III C-methyltransferase [Cyanobacteria bacterium P01_G01_bin.39]